MTTGDFTHRTLLLLNRKSQSRGPREDPEAHQPQCGNSVSLATGWPLQPPASCPPRTESAAERREERAEQVLLCLPPSAQHPSMLSFNILTYFLAIPKPITVIGLDQF